MKVNIFTGYCPTEVYGLSRYDLNLFSNLESEGNLVCIKNKIYLPIDVLRYAVTSYPEADINHVTNETFALVLNHISGKKVVTVFDMGALVLEEEYGPLQRMFYTLNLNGLKNADHIITASDFAKDLLVERFGFSSDKITVVYLGVDKAFISKPKTFKKQKCFQIIYVGNEKPHKNFLQVLQTMKLLKRKGAFKLIKIGRAQSDLRSGHLDFCKKNGIDVEFIDYVDDAKLIEFYRKSDIFITMSDYEGFCFPPLEAAACGIPIVVKGSATLKEIYGGVASVVSTPEQAADEIVCLTSSKREYENAAKKANVFARSMTWEKSIKKVEKIYQKVVKL